MTGPFIGQHLHDRRRRRSLGSVQRMPLQPKASASLTKSGSGLGPAVAVALAMEQFLPLADHAQTLLLFIGGE